SETSVFYEECRPLQSPSVLPVSSPTASTSASPISIFIIASSSTESSSVGRFQIPTSRSHGAGGVGGVPMRPGDSSRVCSLKNCQCNMALPSNASQQQSQINSMLKHQQQERMSSKMLLQHQAVKRSYASMQHPYLKPRQGVFFSSSTEAVRVVVVVVVFFSLHVVVVHSLYTPVLIELGASPAWFFKPEKIGEKLEGEDE
ncbi:hypothetical protein TCAL_09725, partial [Tigriopus californicus]